MTRLAKTLTIRSSPHIGAVSSVDTIMFNVVLAMLPICLFSVYAFGLSALLVLIVATVSCVLTEDVLCRINRKPTTVGDWSAAITGILYGLTLPPGLPLWMVAAGGLLGIGVTKFLFGGLGFNVFNPALMGRAILQAAFPAAMTTWMVQTSGRFQSLPSSTLTMPFTKPVYVDGVSAATPLSAWKFEEQSTSTTDLMMGFTSGSTGETCAILIILGGIYLVARKMMKWQIPVAILGSAALFSLVLHLIDPTKYAGSPFMLFSGGLMLGAVFMATDMVGSPMTDRGCVVYGVLIGVLTVVIRVWGGMPDGVMYAILIGNAATPHIDNWIQPRLYGAPPKKRPKAALKEALKEAPKETQTKALKGSAA